MNGSMMTSSESTEPPAPPAPPLRLPLAVTLLASLALSLIAIYFAPVMNRDGMLYITVARVFDHDGFKAALALFDWPFYSILLCALHKVLPFSMSVLAYGITLVFSALTTWVLVLLLHREAPGRSIWWAVLIALCCPVLNPYRTSVLRDWPAWFFTLLAVWSYLRFHDRRYWGWAVGFAASVILAAVFRLEMVILVVPLGLLMLCDRRLSTADKARFVALPGILVVGLFAALLGDVGGMGHRAWDYANHVDPFAVYRTLQQASQRLAAAILNQFSREHAMLVLVAGMLALIPAKVIQSLGVMLIPRLCEGWKGIRFKGAGQSVYPWLILAWLVMVSVFLLQSYFLAVRYIVPMMLFMMPGLYLAMMRIERRFWWRLMLFAVIVQGVSGAIATRGHEQLYLIDAGHWVGSHVPADALYSNDGRVAFYAGLPYFKPEDPRVVPVRRVHADWLALSTDRDREAALLRTLAGRYQLVRRFVSDGGSGEVLIFHKNGMGSGQPVSGKASARPAGS